MSQYFARKHNNFLQLPRTTTREIHLQCIPSRFTISQCSITQDSPPAWTQEAYRPPRSEYSFCCPNWGWGVPHPRSRSWWGGGGYPIPGQGGTPSLPGVPHLGFPCPDLTGGVPQPGVPPPSWPGRVWGGGTPSPPGGAPTCDSGSDHNSNGIIAVSQTVIHLNGNALHGSS